MNIGQKVRIFVGEPWDVGILESCIEEIKDNMITLYSEHPIRVGKLQTNRFYGKLRYANDTRNYNFYCIPGVEDYSINDIADYEKDLNNIIFFMIGGIES